jgi:hypothetical protein
MPDQQAEHIQTQLEASDSKTMMAVSFSML